MKEIEVGEYVRTEKGIIDKVVINYYGICNSRNCNCKHVSCQKDYYDEEDIVKHSKNIIDLLETGDVIKYIEQTEGREGTKLNCIYITDIHSKIELNEIKEEIKNNGIKLLSIVTKQQFESIKYKI